MMRILIDYYSLPHDDRRSAACITKVIVFFTISCAMVFALFGCAPIAPESEQTGLGDGSAVGTEKAEPFEVYDLPDPEEGVHSYRLTITAETPLVLQVTFDGQTRAILTDDNGNTVVNDSGHPVDISINPDVTREFGTYSLSCGTLRPGSYTVNLSGGEDAGVRFLAQRFSDVPVDAWYYAEGYLDYVVDNGILRTLTNASFGPDNVMSRADVVDALYNAAHIGVFTVPKYEGNAPFADMPLNAESAAKLVWAVEVGIVDADPDNTFRAEEIATYEETAVLIARYAELAGADMTVQAATVLSGVVGADAASEDAREALAWCIDRGVIRTDGDGVNPHGPISFGDASQIFTVLVRDVLGGASL